MNIEELVEIAPGVRQKNDKTYYIRCSIKGTYHYCNKARLDKLIAKYGSIDAIGSAYKSREGKAEQRDIKVTQKPVKAGEETEVQRSYTKLREPQDVRWFSDETKTALRKTLPVLSDNGVKCLQRDLFERNGNYCNECIYWHFCENVNKEWKRYEEQAARDVDQIFSRSIVTYVR